MGCLGFRMFCMCDVRDVGCWACGMFGMWYVRMWDARDVGCGMWDVDLQNALEMCVIKF